MTSTNIIINERATIQSIGEHTNGNCEPVVCLTEDKIFNSVTDTANHYDASISQISAVCNKKAKTCHKMRFCFLRDIDQHLDEIMENNRRNTEKISDLEYGRKFFIGCSPYIILSWNFLLNINYIG